MRPLVVVSSLVSLLMFGACGGGDFLQDPACAAPVTTLSPDLTAHLASGEGTGAFSYDPAGSLLTTVTGSYDRVGGDFEWTEVAMSDAWFERATITGYGYANVNGNLDIVGERLITDVRDLQLREQFRIRRVGCSLERRRREWTASGEREDVETGTYLADQYIYEIERLGGAAERLTEGSRDLNLDYTETITEERTGYSLDGERSGNLGSGEWVFESDEEIASRQGTIRRSTTRERFMDGSQSVDFVDTYSSGASLNYVYDIDYYGNGGGTITGSGLSCTLTFTAGECRYSCNNGERGICYAG